MKKVLVSGSQTSISQQLIKHFLDSGLTVISPVNSAIPSNTTMDIKDEFNEHSSTLYTPIWNRNSWFSAKILAREIHRLYESLDAVLIIHEHPVNNSSFDEITGTTVDTVLNQSIRSTVALVHEIRELVNRDDGFWGFVIPHKELSAGTMKSLAEGAFIYFVNELLNNELNEYWSCGFRCDTNESQGFSRELINVWSKRPKRLRGKWMHYPDEKKMGKRKYYLYNL